MIEWFLTREPEDQFILLVLMYAACFALGVVIHRIYLAHGESRWNGKFRVVKVRTYVAGHPGGSWKTLWDIEEWTAVATEPVREAGLPIIYVWEWKTIETRGSMRAARDIADVYYEQKYGSKEKVLLPKKERRSVVLS